MPRTWPNQGQGVAGNCDWKVAQAAVAVAARWGVGVGVGVSVGPGVAVTTTGGTTWGQMTTRSGVAGHSKGAGVVGATGVKKPK